MRPGKALQLPGKQPAKRNWKDHEDSEPVRLSGVIAGDLNIRESNEAISVGQIEGNASLVTFAGDIEVEKIGGQGKLMTYGGSIQVGHAVGALEAETYGGDIEVNQADSSLVLKSKGGDIQVDGAKAGASIETLGGDIQAMGIQGALAAKTNGGEIEALLVAGPQQGEIALESLGGDVSLIIPKGMAANIHVEMVVRRRDAGETILQSNLSGLTRTIEDEGGDVRIVYTGVLNGGGTKITLKSHAGEVSLNEE